MKVLLPDYDLVIEEGVAEVKNHTLYLYKQGIARSVMYKLAYILFGECECYYCHRKLRTDPLKQRNYKKFFDKISIDHLIPREFGGPTITNNLRPACTECNNRKGNMFEDEFSEYQRIVAHAADKGKKGKNEKRLFKESLRYKQELRRCGRLQTMPSEWLDNGTVKQVWVRCWIDQRNGQAYKRMRKQVKQYNFLLDPIVVSANGVVLDGFVSFQIALSFKLKPLVIRLENVVQLGFESEDNQASKI